jgi:hypothetical protein
MALLTERYADLLTGSYDRVDRIVLAVGRRAVSRL